MADVTDDRPRKLVAPPGWVPAFPGQRPPFQPGHELSIQPGAYSPRKVEPLAQELVELVLRQATAEGSATAYLSDSTYRPAIHAWARAEIQAQLLTEYLTAAAEVTGDGVGDLDAERVKSAYLLLHRAETRAASGRARLGLDPLSRARLGRDVAAGSVDVARLMAALEASVDESAAASSDHADLDDDGGDE